MTATDITRPEILDHLKEIIYAASKAADTDKLFDTLEARPGCEEVYDRLNVLIAKINAAEGLDR